MFTIFTNRKPNYQNLQSLSQQTVYHIGDISLTGLQFELVKKNIDSSRILIQDISFAVAICKSLNALEQVSSMIEENKNKDTSYRDRLTKLWDAYETTTLQIQEEAYKIRQQNVNKDENQINNIMKKKLKGLFQQKKLDKEAINIAQAEGILQHFKNRNQSIIECVIEATEEYENSTRAFRKLKKD